MTKNSDIFPVAVKLKSSYHCKLFTKIIFPYARKLPKYGFYLNCNFRLICVCFVYASLHVICSLLMIILLTRIRLAKLLRINKLYLIIQYCNL